MSVDRQNRSIGAGSAEPKNNCLKTATKKPKHVTSNVFGQTIHVVATRHRFVCVIILATLYISSVIETRPWVLAPWGIENGPFPLLWLVVFTTACTTMAILQKRNASINKRDRNARKKFMETHKKLDGCIVWNAHNTVLGEEALLIYIVSVRYVKNR